VSGLSSFLEEMEWSVVFTLADFRPFLYTTLNIQRTEAETAPRILIRKTEEYDTRIIDSLRIKSIAGQAQILKAILEEVEKRLAQHHRTASDATGALKDAIDQCYRIRDYAVPIMDNIIHAIYTGKIEPMNFEALVKTIALGKFTEAG
jgi:hypothetical protein